MYMAVADWCENTLLQAFFIPSQPYRGGTMGLGHKKFKHWETDKRCPNLCPTPKQKTGSHHYANQSCHDFLFILQEVPSSYEVLHCLICYR